MDKRTLRSKHRQTLESIQKTPVPTTLQWKDVETMLVALGAEVSEGNGSRVRVVLNGVRAVFHRPHLQKEMDKGAVKSLRDFLERAGIF